MLSSKEIAKIESLEEKGSEHYTQYLYFSGLANSATNWEAKRRYQTAAEKENEAAHKLFMEAESIRSYC